MMAENRKVTHSATKAGEGTVVCRREREEPLLLQVRAIFMAQTTFTVWMDVSIHFTGFQLVAESHNFFHAP